MADITDGLVGADWQGWQPLETYPVGTKWASAFHVLCCHRERKWVRFGKLYGELGRWYYSGTNEQSQWSMTAGDEPTHWAPIPVLPS